MTGYQLKDPNATVAYHGTDREFYEQVLGRRGVAETPYANSPVVVDNDIDRILDILK